MLRLTRFDSVHLAEKVLELDCADLMRFLVYGTGAFKQALGRGTIYRTVRAGQMRTFSCLGVPDEKAF